MKLKKQTYLEGALTLIIANLVVKVIGALFKIPLANILKEEGMALFSTAYNFYTVLFVIATAGLPVAVSKMVSESLAKKNNKEVDRIFKAAVSLLSILGIIGALILFIGAKGFASVTGSSGSYLGIIAIAPAIFFVSVLSAFRGYFQGMSNMVPTAFSEVIEALGKLLVGLFLAYIMMPAGIVNAASGAVLGVTSGVFLAAVFMAGAYILNKRKTKSAFLSSDIAARSTKEIFISLLKIAVPITIGAAVSSVTNVIDMVMIRQRLQSIMVTPEMFKNLTEYYGLTPDVVTIGKNITEKPSEILYGAYSGFAVPMFNLPPTIVTALSMSIVPAISSAFALKNYAETKKLTESTVRITTLFSLPCAVGLSVLSGPILLVIYNNIRSEHMLFILAYAVIFVCLVSVTTATLQATGNVMTPVYNMLLGGIVKIVTNYLMVGTHDLNIGGAPISTLLCYMTIATLNLIAVRKVLAAQFNITDNIIKPLISAIVMGAVAFFGYNTIANFIGAPQFDLGFSLRFINDAAPITPVGGDIRAKTIIALGGAIILSAIVYVIMIFMLKAIKKDDIYMMPKGEKLVKLLTKCKFIY
ncbi:MAG: hypothetical protein E7407_03325 [Ruminococcaceae bacterium]|nr:hypothetical protein [Oscillospiraceae bacterium]